MVYLLSCLSILVGLWGCSPKPKEEIASRTACKANLMRIAKSIEGFVRERKGWPAALDELPLGVQELSCPSARLGSSQDEVDGHYHWNAQELILFESPNNHDTERLHVQRLPSIVHVVVFSANGAWRLEERPVSDSSRYR